MSNDYPTIQQFRIWNPDKKHFVISGGTPTMLASFFEHTATLYTVHKLPYQRSTGIIDWKGVPIFEGDQVMATYKEDDEDVSSPGIVEWYQPEAMFAVKLGDPDGENETWGLIKFRVLEVFGHIYADGDVTA